MEFYSSLGPFPFLSGMCELRLGGENWLVPSSAHWVKPITSLSWSPVHSPVSSGRSCLWLPGSPCTRVQLPPLSLASVFLSLLPSPQRGARQLLLWLSLHLCSRRHPKMAICSATALLLSSSRKPVLSEQVPSQICCVCFCHIYSPAS